MPTQTTTLEADHFALRRDLIFSRQERPQGSFYVVKDPATGRFYRFREVEYFILRQLESAAGFQDIGTRCAERFGAEIAPETIERFVASARRLGLLALPGDAPQQAAPQPRIRGNPLYLRVKVFDPDRLFARLARRFDVLFTPQFLVLAGASILFAVGIGLGRTPEVFQELQRLLQPQVILYAWLTILGASVLHETAHGVTCRRFGGEVHEIGFMLIYLQPAFYCNVSDAWLFPEKSKRLWVTFSGAFFELFLWSLAVMTWRITEPESAVHFAALVLMATSGLKNFINFNPLIKLDGYYLLSDLLETPNLRGRAFGYLGSRLRRLAGGPASAVPETTPRERIIYIAYGLLAALYSFWILDLILTGFGSYLIERYRGLGLALFAGIVFLLFRYQLAKLAAGPRRLLGRALGSLASTPPGYVRLGRRGTIALLAGALAVIAAVVPMDLKVTGDFKVLPIQNADIRAEIDGVIAEVAVNEGERVQTGQEIARLDDRELRARRDEVRAEIAAARAPLTTAAGPATRPRLALSRPELEATDPPPQDDGGTRSEALVREATRIRKAEDRLRYGRGFLQKTQALLAQGLISRLDVEKAEEEVAVRERELEEARSGLRITRGEVEAVEATIARLDAERALLEEHIRLARVTTPHAGVVTTPRVKEAIGRFVKKGDLIAEVHQLKTVSAEIEVPEKEIGDVHAGQEVVLKARAYPGRTFAGVVRAVAPAVSEAEGRPWLKVVRVTTAIDNPDSLLISEMSGAAKINCGPRRILDVLTRRIRSYVRVEFWSLW